MPLKKKTTQPVASQASAKFHSEEFELSIENVQASDAGLLQIKASTALPEKVDASTIVLKTKKILGEISANCELVVPKLTTRNKRQVARDKPKKGVENPAGTCKKLKIEDDQDEDACASKQEIISYRENRDQIGYAGFKVSDFAH